MPSMGAILLLGLLLGLLARSLASVPSEKAALLTFKQGLGNSSALSSWSTDVCLWKGVYCSPQGAVVGLVLSNLGLKGTIAPNSLSQLSQLQNLDLSVNELSGAIPSDWNQGGALPSLLALNLTQNRIAAVPAGWGSGGCQRLERALLPHNHLTAFPGGLSLGQLTSLSLVANTIRGSIPGDWNVSSQGKVFILPQAGNASNPCGPVPSSPKFLYDDARASFPLTNNLGSCLEEASSCPHTSTPLPLTGSNLYDLARQNGATAWDAAVLNPGIDPAFPSTALVTLPCYQWGSPAGNYLGGDMAFQRPAWGSEEGAAAVTSLPPPRQPGQGCYLAAGGGSYWQADLGYSLPLRLVLLAIGNQGLLNASITVGDDPYPTGQPCASLNTSAAPATTGGAEGNRTVVLCNATGRYVLISGDVLHLCSVEVYPTVSSASLFKGMTVTKVQQVFNMTSPSAPSQLITAVYNATYNGPRSGREHAEAVDTAALSLDLGYIAPIAGAFLWDHQNVASVLVSNSSLNASGGVAPGAAPCPRGLATLETSAAVLANTTSGVQLLLGTSFFGPNNSTFDCGGAVGRYLILQGGGIQMTVDGIEVYLSQQPGGIQPFPAPPPLSPPPSPSPPPLPPPAKDSSSSNTGAIVGGVVGGLALAAVLGGAAYWCMRRRRQAAPAPKGGQQATGGDVEGGKRMPPSAPAGPEPGLLGPKAVVPPPPLEPGLLGPKAVVPPPPLEPGLLGPKAVVPPPPLEPGLLGPKAVVPPPPLEPGLLGPKAVVPPLPLEPGLLGPKAVVPPPPLEPGTDKPKAASLGGAHVADSHRSASGGTEQGVMTPATPDPMLLVLLSKLRTQREMQVEGTAATTAAADSASPESGGVDGKGGDAGVGSAAAPARLLASPQPSLDSSGPGGPGLSVDMRLWIVNFEDLGIQRVIGEGSFGRVYLAKWRETVVALKLLLNTGVDVGDMEAAAEHAISLSNPILANLEQEATLAAALRHPNIVGFLGICLTPPAIMSEYCSRGSLLDVIHSARQSPAKAAQLDWARRLNMALDSAKGIFYLHSFTPALVHCDLKSPNILVDAHWRCKVCDFNLAKICGTASSMSSVVASNPRWLAPELLRGQSATFASDTYSFGVILWELLTWRLPWDSLNPWQIVTLRQEGKSLEFPQPQDLPGDGGSFAGLDAYVALTRSCWAEDPGKRPPLTEVIAQLRALLSQALQSKVGRARAHSL